MMRGARRIAILTFLLAALAGTGCRNPNHQTLYNPYARPAGRPWFKRADDLPNGAETQLNRFENRIENLFY